MKSRYLNENERPSYDLAVTEWLADQEDDFGGITYKIVLWHQEHLYRSITCAGMAEFVVTTNFLGSLGLVNLLASDATFRGYDAVYVTADDYKKVFPSR